jgi:hypothetical protein
MPVGSSSRSGPPPDPNALRRKRDAGEWVTLPAEGRQGNPPAWPLESPKLREILLWVEEWKRPQAVAWEALGLVRDVAFFVRESIEAEAPGSSVARRNLVRQRADMLGLTVSGLRTNRWRIAGQQDGPSGARGAEGSQVAPRRVGSSSARSRLRVVTDASKQSAGSDDGGGA